MSVHDVAKTSDQSTSRFSSLRHSNAQHPIEATAATSSGTNEASRLPSQHELRRTLRARVSSHAPHPNRLRSFALFISLLVMHLRRAVVSVVVSYFTISEDLSTDTLGRAAALNPRGPTAEYCYYKATVEAIGDAELTCNAQLRGLKRLAYSAGIFRIS